MASEKAFGYIPAEEMQERMAGLVHQGEERRKLEAQWKKEWEAKDRRERAEAARIKRTKVNLYKPQKALTVGQLRKWLSQWHRDTPVHYEATYYDHDMQQYSSTEDHLTYGDVRLHKTKDGAVARGPRIRIIIG